MAWAVLFLPVVWAFIVEVQHHRSLCFSQDLSDNTFVSVQFSPAYEAKPNINVRAFDNKSKLVAERLDTTHPRLAFTTYEGGQYQVCVENLNESDTSVDINFRIGADAKDYSILPDTKALSPIDLQIKKIGEVTKQIQKELGFVRTREDQLRHTNQTISERVVGYSVLTILLLVGLSLFQIVYLRSFFRSKKLN